MKKNKKNGPNSPEFLSWEALQQKEYDRVEKLDPSPESFDDWPSQKELDFHDDTPFATEDDNDIGNDYDE